IEPRPLVAELAVPHREPELWLARGLLKTAATELGCHEVYNYSFVSDRLIAACGAGGQPYVRVRNPVAPELARVRRHVLPSLLGSLAANLRDAEEVRLMELGKGYHPEMPGDRNLPAEVFELAFAFGHARGADLYPVLRSGIASLLSRIGCACSMTALAEPRDRGWIHPGRTVAIHAGTEEVGYVGTLHPEVAEALDLPLSTAIACLDLRAILRAGQAPRQMTPIPRFPSQPVDVALVVPTSAKVAEVATFLRSVGGELVRAVELFEVYRGDRVPPGSKSLNFTVVLGAPDRTLTAEDEARYLDRVRSECRSIGAELRG
ncbi:MAG TPA: hypothetical protein VK081_01660, partial [Planctomycetota bacterium]|nr:hypothetical protein [Planctomycetota bacterium]